MTTNFQCGKCSKYFINNRDLAQHLARKFPCVKGEKSVKKCVGKEDAINVKKCVEKCVGKEDAINVKKCVEKCGENESDNISLSISEIFPPDYISEIMKAYDVLYDLKYKNYYEYHFIFNLKRVNRQFKELYFSYELKNKLWKPIKSKCIADMMDYLRKQRERNWKQRNKLVDLNLWEHKWRSKMCYLLVDVRDLQPKRFSWVD